MNEQEFKKFEHKTDCELRQIINEANTKHIRVASEVTDEAVKVIDAIHNIKIIMGYNSKFDFS